LGDQRKVANVLANGPVKLMAEDEAGEGATLALPLFGEGFEPDVLGEEQTSERGAASEKFWIGQESCIVVLSSRYIHTLSAKLVCNGNWDMDIKIKRSHATAPFRRAAMSRRRIGEAGARSAASSSLSSALNSASISPR
jgi:hypothetical protein